MRVAYADPPYIGQSRKHYGREEVDHGALVKELCSYDAWALSCSSPTLGYILQLCPSDVRVAAWVKPFCAFKVNVNPAYAWEPVVFKTGRRHKRTQVTVRDWCSAVITLKRGVSGAKPETFCFWLFRLLNLDRDDEFVDLFPGSGAVTRAWHSYTKQLDMGDWLQ